VQTEIQAQLSLQSILKIDSALSQAANKAKVSDPKDAKFHKTNAASISQLKRAVQQLNKSYPDTKATQQASVIGAKYGIDSN